MIYQAPTYLTGLVTEVNNTLLFEIQKKYGDYITAFIFKTKFIKLERTWKDEYKEFGGAILGFDKENREIIIFNPTIHGYEGMFGLSTKEDLSKTKNIETNLEIEVVIAFQYSGDEAEYIEEGASKFEQDYFGTVAVYKYIDSKLTEILNYECA
jgi:hypothetical protein